MRTGSALIRPRGLLFDMDGTLTRPVLDFGLIKREMGIEGKAILEALAEMSEVERAKAEAILHRHEDMAAEEAELNPGCKELLGWAIAQGMRMALITRNRRQSVETVMRRHDLPISVLITREDGRFKPDAEPLLLACEKLSILPAEAWMIGDGQYDIEAGTAAGIRSVWVSHGKEKTFEAEAWRTVEDLWELLKMLEN